MSDIELRMFTRLAYQRCYGTHSAYKKQDPCILARRTKPLR